MKMTDLRQPPHATTLMGVLQSALGYYELPWSVPAIFGGSGHAFLINIHPELCPSGPYCWNRHPFFGLVKNLGVDVTDLGFYSAHSSPDDRAAIEARLRSLLDSGYVCSLLNLENQLIVSYDDHGFNLTQPWEGHDFPPNRLSYGAWSELGESVHISFLAWRPIDPEVFRDVARASLRYAIDLRVNPRAHSIGVYAVGPDAYDAWIRAVEHGDGDGHGNWWNGNVWSECRRHAGLYLDEIADRLPEVAELARPLAWDYQEIGQLLAEAMSKELAADRKIQALRQASEIEAATPPRLQAIIDAIERT